MMPFQYDPLFLFIVSVLGLLLGSFNTMLCYRIPREIPLGLTSHQRSRCPHCTSVIHWYHNIPILGFLMLRGRCAHCHKKIPLQYFLIELSTLAFFILTYLIHENSVNRSISQVEDVAELGKLLLFTLALVSTVFIDIEFRIIPDRYSLGMWAVALLAAALWGPNFLDSALGGVIGFGLFFLMSWSYEKLKGVEGLGFGDVKMMGWLGTWVGVVGVPFTILVASLTGLVVGLIAMRSSKEGFKTAIPFGPFLAFGGYLAWALLALGFF
jgi:leader peptidase (prepilin peptidase)/N-methyltransferase